MRILAILFLIVVSSGLHAQRLLKPMLKKLPYEEVKFEDMMRRYFQKETSHDLEGIYSVSCVIVKRSKPFLSKHEREKVMKRKDNYARVAILKDWPGTKREFIEVSMSYRDTNTYPIVGDFHSLSEGNGYIYTHIEPDKTTITFSMIQESPELLEGEYSKIERRKRITYRLSYLKIFPKGPQVVNNY